MKELEHHKSDAKEIVREVHEGQAFLGSIVLSKGLVYWELDMDTFKITRAELTEERIEVVERKSLFGFKTGKFDHMKVQDLKTKDNCKYEIAINLLNAKRKFIKRIQHEIEIEEANPASKTARKK